jgi:hypothetical protein
LAIEIKKWKAGGMPERQRIPVNPGKVEWVGDNPGIFLKESEDGDWVSLALYFRVVYSPQGCGKAILVLDEPDGAEGYPQANNLCITDNEPMMRYLVADYARNFPAFRGRSGLQAVTYLPLESSETLGDFKGEYSEVVQGGGVSLRMTWRQIGKPVAIEVTPEHAVTGAHDMYNVFIPAGEAEIAVNGQPLSGSVISRPLFGQTMKSAFLAFSETWVTPLSAG